MSMPTRQQVYEFVKRMVGPNYYGDNIWADVYPPLVSTRNGGRKSQFCAGGVIYAEKHTGVPQDQWMAPGIPKSLWVPTCRATAMENGTWGDVSRISSAKLMDKLTFDWNDDKQSDHVGFFVSMYDARRVNTIEYNTSRNGDGTQVGIWERVRYLSDIQGFIRSPYLDDETTPVQDKPTTTIVTVDSFDGVLGPNTIKAIQRYYVAAKRVPASAIDGSFEGPSLTVTEIQKDLIRLGFLPPNTADGYLGPNTKAALQKRFDAKTWKQAVQKWQYQMWSSGYLR